MKVIYHCYGGAHSSVTAANIHLGLLPGDGTPRYRDLAGQRLFDNNKFEDSGKICFMGRDSLGNEIYIVGRRSRPQLLYSVIEGLQDYFDVNPRSYLIVDMSDQVNISMKIGGFLSRRLGLVSIGRPLVTWGTLRAYRGILNQVGNTKELLKSSAPSTGRGLISTAKTEVNL